MKQIIEIVDDKKNEETYGFNMDNVLDNGAKDASAKPEKPRKRGPGRPPKNENPYSPVPVNTYTEIVTEDSKKEKKTFEEQIEAKYAPQAAMIAGIVNQTDTMYSNIEAELQNYRNKMGYGGKTRNMVMAELQNTQVALINAKLAAVRELNNMRHKVNDLTMKHVQITRDDGTENSDKAVMDSYYALVNATRYGLPAMHAPLHPASINTGINLQGQAVPTGVVGGSTGIVTGNETAPVVGAMPTASSVAGLTPVQQRMVLEKNPNIKTVVVYNQSTGSRRFEVIDVTTGMAIPGVARPADFLLDDLKPDMRSGIAVNSATNQVYPLVIEGTRAADEL